MTKSISANLQTHIQQEVTTLATCWRLVRTDGVELYFTDHDQDIVFGGNTYKAGTSYSRTAVQNESSLSVDNLNVEGILDSDDISTDDMRKGLFDFAEIFVFMVNWTDLSQNELKMRRGRLGEVSITAQGVFRAELRGLVQAYSQRIGELYSPECRADLGDSRCKVPIDPGVLARSTAYSLGDYVKVATDTGATGQAQYENRIYECTFAGTTADATTGQPTYDTTIGNTTNDGDIVATSRLNLTGNAVDTETLLIDAKTYVFDATLDQNDGHVLIGGTPDDTLSNLIAAINLDSGAGTSYGSSMTLHPTVSASDDGTGTSMVATAKTTGSAGNDISLAESLSNGSWVSPSTLLSGGVDGARFTSRQSWTRHAVVEAVTSRQVFTFTSGFDETRAVDDWFNGGVVVFEDGTNSGKAFEVRDWDQTSRVVTLFLPAPFDIATNTLARIYPGCDKRAATCGTKFVIPNSLDFDSGKGNIENFRGEPFLPGQDQLTNYPDAK